MIMRIIVVMIIQLIVILTNSSSFGKDCAAVFHASALFGGKKMGG